MGNSKKISITIKCVTLLSWRGCRPPSFHLQIFGNARLVYTPFPGHERKQKEREQKQTSAELDSVILQLKTSHLVHNVFQYCWEIKINRIATKTNIEAIVLPNCPKMLTTIEVAAPQCCNSFEQTYLRSRATNI